jgi:hypothetical protein
MTQSKPATKATAASWCSLLLEELRLLEMLRARRDGLLGGAGDLLEAITRRLTAAATDPPGLTPAAIHAAVELSRQVLSSAVHP